MEPLQKLMQTLCEIWVEEDIKLGKIKHEKSEDTKENGDKKQNEQFHEAA